MLSAQRRLKDFADRNGWADLVKDRFADQAEIFNDKAEFDAALIRLTGADPSTKLPKTYSAALEKGVFLSVSPRLYQENYPQGSEDGAFEKLVAHEMAHRLHIRILKGDEDAMGPIWFYEGFAIHAAGQFETLPIRLSPEEIQEVVDSATRGSYAKYGAAFRHFLEKAPIQELVKRAGGKDFPDYLRRIDRPFLLTQATKGDCKGTILLVQGSAPFNIDGRIPVKGRSAYHNIEFYRDMADALNSYGWDVVRYAKPGVYKDRIDLNEYDKTDLATIMRQLNAIWNEMPSRKPRIIFAWSEGTLHASRLPLSEASAVILLGAISTNIRDVILAQGGSPKEIKAIRKMGREEMLGIDRPAGRLLDELAMADNWRFFEKHPDLPMLILHGEEDTEVPASHAKTWKTMLPRHRIDLVLKPSGNHMFGVAQSPDIAALAGTIQGWLAETLQTK
ncbi:MAG: hypothetical protein HZB91_08750 [Elusimicrobia bacterium]|nr:hypothetical protein [Elusimicrobiota bacterium]